MDTGKPVNPSPHAAAVSVQEQALLDAVRSTPFGSVEVVLHQSRIVQVIRTERMKLDAEPGAPR